MRYRNIGYVTKNTILTKKIMLGVVGWTYMGKSYLPFGIHVPREDRKGCYVARNERGEKVNIGETMQEAEEFCLQKYKEFYNQHPEMQEKFPNPYNRKKVKSEIIIVREERSN